VVGRRARTGALLSEVQAACAAPTTRLYRLVPTPGRTDQLRRYLCGLGIPLVGDPL